MTWKALLGLPTYFMLAQQRLLFWMLLCSVGYFCNFVKFLLRARPDSVLCELRGSCLRPLRLKSLSRLKNPAVRIRAPIPIVLYRTLPAALSILTTWLARLPSFPLNAGALSRRRNPWLRFWITTGLTLAGRAISSECAPSTGSTWLTPPCEPRGHTSSPAAPFVELDRTIALSKSRPSSRSPTLPYPN